MKDMLLLLMLGGWLAACAPAPSEPPTGPGVEQLAARPLIVESARACLSAEENPLAATPDAAAMAFAAGLWRIESQRAAGLFGAAEPEESRALANIQPVLKGNGYVEYLTGRWDGELFLQTNFWGAVGSLQRWTTVETNTAHNSLNSLRGDFNASRGFSLAGEMFGERVELRLTNIQADSFDWLLYLRGADEPAWTRHYTRLADRAELEALLPEVLAGLEGFEAPEAMQPLSFLHGGWDWIEHHVETEGDCAAGQALVQWVNGGTAQEERVHSAYDPEVVNAPLYTDYSLTIWNEEAGAFQTAWWTTGAILPRLSEGVCEVVDGAKQCTLRAVFKPSEDENYIEWTTQGFTIEWLRQE